MTQAFTQLATAILHGMRAVDDAARDISEKQSDETSDTGKGVDANSAGTGLQPLKGTNHDHV
ncbi:hypothetical protein BISA_0099 [Bifidobacterium saguini DSM 23967]|uniref:Uncharacterized protein n=3 Tax=Bifidobacterium TaxID=1678 RepID=A0A2N5ISA8_9BIFI|nr:MULTISPECIES: hypothetical protein [Bifidobacterium]KFI94064.1 hypothetical protein BISA_0099 [Bifidobacterium saguini DSM 23967]PLS24830.1 hypothetical protein Tam1G_1158 [Bifidobacterium imperatoris]QSY57955.1 hypothetical protein BLI708_01065 [Bifidobacterium imperatoris]QTB90372.1 hypothetical protein BSD967_08530 [Bifidobacterium saguini]